MKKGVFASFLLISSIVLGWFLYSLGQTWFLSYLLFGGPIMMAVFAAFDGTAESKSLSRTQSQRMRQIPPWHFSCKSGVAFSGDPDPLR